MALLQAAIAPAQDGIRIEPAWIITAVSSIITALVTALGVTYRGQVQVLTSENKRKDDLVDRLIAQIGRAADAQDRTVTLIERGKAQR